MSIWWPVCCWNNWIPNQFRRLRSHKRNCHGRNTVIEFLIKFTAPQTTTQTDRGWLVNFTYTHWTPKYLDSNSNRERGTLLVTTITIPMFDIIWQPVNSFLNYAVWLRGSKGRTKGRKGTCCGTLCANDVLFTGHQFFIKYYRFCMERFMCWPLRSIWYCDTNIVKLYINYHEEHLEDFTTKLAL